MLLIEIQGRKAGEPQIEKIIINIAMIISIVHYHKHEYRIILRDNLYYYVDEGYKNIVMRKVNALY